MALKRIFKIISIILLIGAFALIFISFWLGHGHISPAKEKFLRIFPYPLSVVNGRIIFAKDFILRTQTAKKLGDAGALNSFIYNRLILEEEVRQIAASFNLFVAQNEVNDAYILRSKEADFLEQIKGFGLNEQTYKNEVLKPELLLEKVKIWFCSQRDLNPEIYKIAANFVERLKKGDDFAKMANQYSQSSQGQPLNGDLGFVDVANLLPEVREKVEAMKVGDISVIPSRFGLHILKKESQANNQTHLRQIFLKNDGFNNWLYNETNKFNVWNLVKI